MDGMMAAMTMDRRVCYNCGEVGHLSRDCPISERTACKLVVELQPTTRPVILYWVENAGGQSKERKMLDSRSAPDPTRLVCRSYLGDEFTLRTEGGTLLRRITLREAEAEFLPALWQRCSLSYRVVIRDHVVAASWPRGNHHGGGGGFGGNHHGNDQEQWGVTLARGALARHRGVTIECVSEKDVRRSSLGLAGWLALAMRRS